VIDVTGVDGLIVKIVTVEGMSNVMNVMVQVRIVKVKNVMSALEVVMLCVVGVMVMVGKIVEIAVEMGIWNVTNVKGME
jgi:hypothetical protein